MDGAVRRIWNPDPNSLPDTPYPMSCSAPEISRAAQLESSPASSTTEWARSGGRGRHRLRLWQFHCGNDCIPFFQTVGNVSVSAVTDPGLNADLLRVRGGSFARTPSLFGLIFYCPRRRLILSRS